MGLLEEKIKDRVIEKGGFIVAIDGPSGVGKSEVSKKLAKSLNGRLLDTGLMYRALAFVALKKNTEDPHELENLSQSLSFTYCEKMSCIKVNEMLMGPEIRTSEVSQMASKVSQYEQVRSILTQKQRELATKWSKTHIVIVEGRDIGTVVFPETPHKFFITANQKERARRRFFQLKEKSVKITLKKVYEEQRERDQRDQNRSHAPLKAAENAIKVNTSKLSLAEVVDKIVRSLFL